MPVSAPSPAALPVTRRELFAWAMYDFANSGYTTVVLTTVFNAYFVAVIAAPLPQGTATLLWTLGVAAANALVLLSAPLVGAVADHLALKKRFLLITTLGCVTATALLALVGPGDIVLAMLLLIIASVMFASGEYLIAAFLPELTVAERMGRISGYGWSLGYFGGLLTLALCLLYIGWAKGAGQQEGDYVPVTLLITAAVFALAATPTFLWLRERAIAVPLGSTRSYGRVALQRLRHTLAEARRFRDLFRFLLALTVFQAGVSTVVVLAAIYARQVMGFDSEQLVILIMVVNVTAIFGAFGFGFIQDRIGSIRMLVLSLLVWIAAIVLAYFASRPADIWLVGNLIGIAMGASQSGGRALIGQFTPPARCGEFFGLWGLVSRLAAIAGPVSYGVISYWSGGNHRLAILSTLAFFVAGLALLARVDERRGRAAAVARPAGTDRPR